MSTNNKPLKIFYTQELYHYVDGVKILGTNPEMRGNCTGLRGNCSGLRGDCSELQGDCSELWGNCTGLRGDCSGLRGNLDLITTNQRKEDSHILFYGEVQS